MKNAILLDADNRPFTNTNPFLGSTTNFGSLPFGTPGDSNTGPIGLKVVPQGTTPISGSISGMVSLTDISAGEYETVAASATAQVLGTTGAIGDYVSGLLVVPANTSPANVLLLDGAISITVFAGGATSVSNLVPFFIPLGMKSVTGAWKVTTGASVSVIAVGNFT